METLTLVAMARNCAFCNDEIPDTDAGYATHIKRYHRAILSAQTLQMLAPKVPKTKGQLIVEKVEYRLREEGRLIE